MSQKRKMNLKIFLLSTLYIIFAMAIFLIVGSYFEYRFGFFGGMVKYILMYVLLIGPLIYMDRKKTK